MFARPQPAENNSKLTGDFWTGLQEKSQERVEQRVENIDRYKVSVTDDEYEILNQSISTALIPEDEAHNWATALQYSRNFGTPLDETYANLEAINDYWLGPSRGSPKSNFKAVTDSFILGKNTLELGDLGGKLLEAESTGNEEMSNLLQRRIAEINTDNSLLADNQPRPWTIDALKFGAQSAPFTGYVIGAGLIGSVLTPFVGTATSFGASMKQQQGLEYLRMREQGVDKNYAKWISTLSGGLQAVVEVALGNVAGNLSKATGANTITSGVLKRLTAKGTFGKIGKVLMSYGMEALEEGAEEAIQELIGAGASALAAELQGQGVETDTASEIARSTLESFKGGFLGSLVLGISGASLNARTEFKHAAILKDQAESIGSKEAFIKESSESIAFEGMTDTDRVKTQESIWDAAANRREERINAEAADIAEMIDTDEETEGDENENLAPTGETVRLDTGRLHVQEGKDVIQNEDGSVTRILKAGDPTRETKTNRYGYIKFREYDNRVVVDEFRMQSGHQDIQSEFFQDFSERVAGKEIEWDPTGKRSQALKESIISNNPSGSKVGLQYFTKESDPGNIRGRIVHDQQIAKHFPKMDATERATAIALVETYAEQKGLDLVQFLESSFQDGVFAEAGSVIPDAAQAVGIEPGKVKGGVSFSNDVTGSVKALIYVTENSDFSTYVHEMAHVFRKGLDGDLLSEAESALGVQEGKWTRENEEKFAVGFEEYLREGTAPTEGLTALFKKMAEFLQKVYKAIANRVEVSPEIRRVYDQLLAGDGPLSEIAKEQAEAVKQPTSAKVVQADTAIEAKTTKIKKEDISGNTGMSFNEQARKVITDAGEAYKTIPDDLFFQSEKVKKLLEHMTREELVEMLHSSDSADGLPNYRAYLRDVKADGAWPVQVSLDADSLKWVNDNMGHATGDLMLKTIGKKIKIALEGLEIRSYHKSGDEFLAQAKTVNEYLKFKSKLDNLLKDVILTVRDEEFGGEIEKPGIFVSDGIDNKGDMNAADKNLGPEKSYRENHGERAGRGKVPPGTRIIHDSGRISDDKAAQILFRKHEQKLKKRLEKESKNAPPVNQFTPTRTRELRKIIEEGGDILFQTAYHGTPHSVERFSTDHIGSGEGNQSYGWGLYFAGSKDVADWYRQKLSKRNYNSLTEELFDIQINGIPLNEKYPDLISALSGVFAERVRLATKPEGIINHLEKLITQFTDLSNDETYPYKDYALRISASAQGLSNELKEGAKIQFPEGHLYKVDIPEHDDFLAFDTPWKDQGKKIVEALEKEATLYRESEGVNGAYINSNGTTGEQVYREMSRVYGGDKAASLHLDSLGIYGLRYLDGNSRSKGDGSSNYVVFDDSQVKIDEILFQTEEDPEVVSRIGSEHLKDIYRMGLNDKDGLRSSLPNVRGGWTEAKIIRELKANGARLYSTISVARMIAYQFKTAEDLQNHIYYHGTTSFIDGAIRPSITMSDAQVEARGGGGYGAKYWGISLSKQKRTAENFSGSKSAVTIYAALLDKRAVIKEIPGVDDSADLGKYIEDLWNEGVDAVWIGGGEQELVVLNPKAIRFYKESDFYKAYGGKKSENMTLEKAEELLRRVQEIVAPENQLEQGVSLPRLLFQTEEEIITEASSFDTWQDFMEFYEEDSWTRPEDAAVPENADAQWYQSVWEKSKGLVTEESLNESEVAARVELDNQTPGGPEVTDALWTVEMRKPGKLEEFLKQINWILTQKDTFAPSDESELASVENIDRMKRRITVELRHGSWISNATRLGVGRELTEKARRTLLTLMGNAPRDYRALYADIMEDSEWQVSLADTEAGRLSSIADPEIDYTEMSPEQRRKVAEKIDNAEIAEKLKTGELTTEEAERHITYLNSLLKDKQKEIQGLEKEEKAFRDEVGSDYRRISDWETRRLLELKDELDMARAKYESRSDKTSRMIEKGQAITKKYQFESQQFKANYDTIFRKFSDLSRAMEISGAVKTAIARRESLFEARSESARLQGQINANREARKIRTQLVKKTMRRVRFENVNYDEARKVIAIQRKFSDALYKGLNKWLGTQGPYLREVYSRWKTDEDYRNKLSYQFEKSHPRKWKKMSELLEKDFDTWTNSEREKAIDFFPKEDWIEELELDKLAQEREESLQMDETSTEFQKIVADALSARVIARIEKRPFAEWTIEEMEELAAVVDKLYSDGRKLLIAKKEAAREDAFRMRSKIKSAILDPGYKDGDTPEDKKLKDERIQKKLGYGLHVKGTLADSLERKSLRARLMNKGYIDANVRRVARFLDGGKEGVNTDLLYHQEDLCYNVENRIIRERNDAISKAMEFNGVTMEDLFKTVSFPDLMETGRTESFTVDELLFILKANDDDQSQRAVMFGNFLSDTEKETWGTSQAAEEMLENFARPRYEAVLSSARALPQNILAFADVISNDYTAQYERMNKASIAEFNKPVWRVNNYVPLIRLESSGDTNENRVAEDLLGMSSSRKQTGAEKGMTQKRIDISAAYQRPVQLGLYTTWVDSVKRTEHFIAYAPYVRELNRIYKGLDAGNIRGWIRTKHGDGMLKYIDQYINEVANPDAIGEQSGVDRVIRTIRGRTAPAYLAWKMSGILKQFATSPAPYFAHVSPAEYAAASFDFARNYSLLSDSVREKSVFMDSRVMDPLIDLIREQQSKTGNKAASAWDQFTTLGMQGLEFADWSCVAPGWLAVYRRTLGELETKNKTAFQIEFERLQAENEKGLVEEMKTDAELKTLAEKKVLDSGEIEFRAIKAADDVTRLCQPSSRITDLAPLFKERGKGTEALKILTQFQTSLNVIWQNIRYDLPQAVREKQWSVVVGTVGGYVAAGIAVNLLTEGLFGGGDDDDPEAKVRDLVYFATTQFTEAVPLVGDAVSALAKKAITGSSDRAMGEDFYPALSKVFQAGSAMAAGDWDKGAQRFGEGIGYVFGAPVSGAKEAGRLIGIGDKDGSFNFNPEALLGRRK